MVFLTGRVLPWPPEQRAKKTQTAEIDAADIADFVRAPRIIRRKNFHILTEEQARQRERHQRPVQHAVAKTKGCVFWKGPSKRPAVKPADQCGDDQKCGNFFEPELPARDRDSWMI